MNTCINLSVAVRPSVKRGVSHKSSPSNPLPPTSTDHNRKDTLWSRVILQHKRSKHHDIEYAFKMNTYASFPAGVDDNVL